MGLQSAGYAMGAKVPRVMGYGALTWEIDLLGWRRVMRFRTEEVRQRLFR
jgi:hypothetical protein